MNRPKEAKEKDTGGHLRFSASRFFQVTLRTGGHSGWYYHAREGTFGPFISPRHAEQDLLRLIERNPNERLDLYRRLGISTRKS